MRPPFRELWALQRRPQYGIGLLPWSPLAGGLLARAVAKAGDGRRGDESALLGHSAREQHRVPTPLDITLNDETSSRLNELFPGPGGEAPDAYTWS